MSIHPVHTVHVLYSHMYCTIHVTVQYTTENSDNSQTSATANPETVAPVFGSRFANTDKFAPGDVLDWSQCPWFLYYSSAFHTGLLLRFYTHCENREGFRIAKVSQFTILILHSAERHLKSS